MPKLTVIYKDPKTLRPREKNPRKHPKRQIEQLKRSITEFGFVRPVLLDGSDGIIAGHGSTLAAIELGMTDIPTVRVDHLSPEQIRAYVIADNKLAENAGWDRELLALELKELSLNFDLTLTGFEMPEVDLLLGELDGSGSDAADEIPEVDTRLPPVSRLGDLWRIGGHFLLCGDSTKRESYEALLQGAKAQAVFTDPPYNVRIAGNVSGLGKTVHPEFAMASGEMSRDEFTKFLATVFRSPGRVQRRWLATLYMHGLAPHARGAGCRDRLQRTQKPLRLGEDQCWHGQPLSLPARADFRVQARHSQPYQ